MMRQSKVSKAVQHYFRNTTLHGFKYLSSVHYVDRVVWVVWCAGSLCVVLWRRYLQVPALLVLCDDDARTLSYVRYGVPTVAVCLPPTVVADMFVHALSPNSTLTKDIPTSLDRVIAGKTTLTEQLVLLDNLLAARNTTLADMMMNYAPSCDEETIMKCRYQKRMVPCQLFEKKLTYWGVCCVMEPEKILPKYNTGLVSRSHTMQSLELVLQCRRGYYASACQFITFYKGEEWVQPNVVYPSNYYMAHLVFTLIPDEPASLVETSCSHDPNYSRTLCMRRCAEKACGCRDPLFIQGNSDKILPLCTTARLICLRAYDLKKHENISCSCLPPCRKITTTMVLESSPMNQINNTIDDLFSGIDVSRSVVMNLRVNLHHSQVFLLNPTETWVTLLSSLGGVFNMFLGVGLFSALELIYFLLVKLPVAIRKSSEVDHTKRYNQPLYAKY